MAIVTSQTPNYERLVLRFLEGAPSEKHRDIVKRRFGIGQDEEETLEKIGGGYGITRERVRQIEESSLKHLGSSPEFHDLRPAREFLKHFIDRRGSAIREEKLVERVTSPRHHAPIRFLLAISPEFHFSQESELLHPFWTTDPKVIRRIERFLHALHRHLEDHSHPIDEKEFHGVVEREAKLRNFSGDAFRLLAYYLDIAKTIRRTVEGAYGLSHWSEVTPRGVRDKSYIVLRQKKEPSHFRTIADLINATPFPEYVSPRRAHYQTVHNELIKDKRFVLVGRGLYALREWGYEPGTVKDVIRKILKESAKPLTKEEILEKVLGKRRVKENTIILNLQNKHIFSRLPSGEYALVK